MNVLAFPRRMLNDANQRYCRVAPEFLGAFLAALPGHIRVSGSLEAVGQVVLVLTWIAGAPPAAREGVLEIQAIVARGPWGISVTLEPAA